MNKRNTQKFKRIFDSELAKIVYQDRIVREEFRVNTDDRFDEIDQASSDMEQSMRMRLCNRETLYLKKIQDALKRIEDGIFGDCDECGEDIELRRLEARPTATLCVSCKEDQERREGLTVAGRVHKSMGQTFSRRLA